VVAELVADLVTDVVIGTTTVMRTTAASLGRAARVEPGHQIRSQPSPVPAHPPGPAPSLLVLVNGRIAGSSRASIPARHAPHGRSVVAGSSRRRRPVSDDKGTPDRAEPSC
jgi:hypothetical protein